MLSHDDKACPESTTFGPHAEKGKVTCGSLEPGRATGFQRASTCRNSLKHTYSQCRNNAELLMSSE